MLLRITVAAIRDCERAVRIGFEYASTRSRHCSRYTVGLMVTLLLDDNELKLLLAAIRQVQHTFAIAEQQSQAAGEPLAPEYQPIEEAYRLLEQKLVALVAPGAQPFRVK